MSPGDNRLAVLAADIRAAHADVGRNTLAAAERALAAGRMLAEAKAALAHGEWAAWLTEHTGISGRTARRYMTLARSGLETATVADMGIRGAAEMLARAGDSMPPPGEYAWSVARPWTFAFVWRCREQAGRFHVVVFSNIDDDERAEVIGTRHPVPKEMVHLTLEQSGFPAAGHTGFQFAAAQGDWVEKMRLLACDGAA